MADGTRSAQRRRRGSTSSNPSDTPAPPRGSAWGASSDEEDESDELDILRSELFSLKAAAHQQSGLLRQLTAELRAQSEQLAQCISELDVEWDVQRISAKVAAGSAVTTPTVFVVGGRQLFLQLAMTETHLCVRLCAQAESPLPWAAPANVAGSKITLLASESADAPSMRSDDASYETGGTHIFPVGSKINMGGSAGFEVMPLADLAHFATENDVLRIRATIRVGPDVAATAFSTA